LQKIGVLVLFMFLHHLVLRSSVGAANKPKYCSYLPDN